MLAAGRDRELIARSHQTNRHSQVRHTKATALLGFGGSRQSFRICGSSVRDFPMGLSLSDGIEPLLIVGIRLWPEREFYADAQASTLAAGKADLSIVLPNGRPSH